MMSQKARYALRALIYLADRDPEQPVLIADIAEHQRVPKKFLELILLDLKRHGVVHSMRGKHGGYSLAKKPDDVSFGQVVRIIDGPLAQVPCVSKTAYRRCEDCDNEQTCAIRHVMGQVRDSTAKILDGTSLRAAMNEAVAEVLLAEGI